MSDHSKLRELAEKATRGPMMDDGRFGEAIHALLKELGWTHGELTSSLVLQALAQVRHLRKQAEKLAAVTAARDEACEIAEAATFVIDNGLCCKCRSGIENVSHERIDTLRKAGQP